MTETLDLQKAERKASTLTFQDGLLDLAVGLELLVLVLAPLLERTIPLNDWWIALLSLPILAALLVGKRCITTPRLGRVRFLAAHKARMRVVTTILGSLLFGGLLAGTAFFWLGQGQLPVWLGQAWFSAILWAGIALLIFGLAAYALGLPRLCLYGLLYAGIYAAQVLPRTRPEWGLLPLVAGLISAAVPLVIGFFLLARFLRSYPLRGGEEYHGRE